MKKTLVLIAVSMIILLASTGVMLTTRGEGNNMQTTNLFINASQNQNGNTARLAKAYFGNKKYKQINLVDYNIKQLGQVNRADDFEKVRAEIENAQHIVIGTPMYWSDMTGLLKTFIDRHESVDDRYDEKKLSIIVQGTAPTTEEVQSISHIFEHWSERFGMKYQGVIR